MKEPALLPTTFPNILVSANQGIAVGMASQLCGFNLGEVCDTTIAFLKNPEVRISETCSRPTSRPAARSCTTRAPLRTSTTPAAAA